MEFIKKNWLIFTVGIVAILFAFVINANGGGQMGARTTADVWDDQEGNAYLDGNATTTGTFYVGGNTTLNNLTYGATTVASSTANATETLLVSDLTTYSGMDYTPGDLAVTLTLPATSTMTSFVASAGNCFDWRFRNLDDTSATSTTIVAGTGIDLVMPEATGADVIIEGGNEAKLKFCRELDSDVTVYVTEYVSTD